jgi:TonB dependent receptor
MQRPAVGVGGGNGAFSQNVQRLGFYVQDSWRATPSFTVNVGLRYDTTYGLFIASGRGQTQNPAYVTLKALGIHLAPGIPHDYRGALAPRIGVAWSPGNAGKTVLRAGFGLYYNDLAQNGWVNAFQAVNTPFSGLLTAGDQGALIDPGYKGPYAVQASFNFEQAFARSWTLDVRYEHQEGDHQYRRYEYISGYSLPADAPNISLFRSDNRSRYDGAAFGLRHRFSSRFDLSAYYTLASATTWGAVVGELFDYVNGVSNVNNAFGPGDHGPSGEDVRHRFVAAGSLMLPGKLELSSLSQVESARPFTLVTPIDVNHDGDPNNDRAVINGRQTSLDEFRGTPYMQIDLRVSRSMRVRERYELRPFVEFFNLFNRTNPGNSYVAGVDQLPVPPNQLANVTRYCLNAGCTATRPIRRNDLRVPAGALGDFFGPGTTVGIPFAAQLGVRFTF